MTTKTQGSRWGIERILLPVSCPALVMLFAAPGSGFGRKLLLALLIGIALCFLNFGKQACQGGGVSLLSWLLGAAVGCLGVSRFRCVWADSRLFLRLQNVAMLDQSHGIYLVGLVLAVLATAAIAAFVSLPLGLLFKGRKELPKMDDAWEHLRRNRYLPLSAVAFFALWTEHERAMGPECIAMVISLVFSAWVPPFPSLFREQKRVVQVLACLGTVGMCWYLRANAWYYGRLTVAMAVLASPFLLAALLVFWERLESIFRENGVFAQVSRWEWCLYGLLLGVSLVLCIGVYSNTAAFHIAATDYDALWDVIYTADSPYLVRKNAYMNFVHTENDIRSPLFALFSAPFAALAYLPGAIFRLSMHNSLPLLLNLGQLVVLFLSFFLLAQAAGLQPGQRAAFLTIAFCTYTYQLFGLMMEQYIYAFFWLSLAIFLFCRRGKTEPIALLGAGGTMLTSLALVPFMTGENPKKSFRRWFCACAGLGITFLLLIAGSGRIDLLVDFEKMQTIRGFMRIKLNYPQKWAQYSWFVRNIFLAPKAGPDFENLGHAAWQLLPITSVSVTGVLLFAASLICCVWERKRPICQCCGGWILLSLFVLLVMGWGTAENGLILYSLYFGWAFLIPLFSAVCRIAQRRKLRWLLPALSAAAIALLVIVNVPELGRMIEFAAEFYPRVG